MLHRFDNPDLESNSELRSFISQLQSIFNSISPDFSDFRRSFNGHIDQLLHETNHSSQLELISLIKTDFIEVMRFAVLSPAQILFYRSSILSIFSKLYIEPLGWAERSKIETETAHFLWGHELSEKINLENDLEERIKETEQMLKMRADRLVGMAMSLKSLHDHGNYDKAERKTLRIVTDLTFVVDHSNRMRIGNRRQMRHEI
jgi:hypothetical protein